jgi:hypothetical protein
MKRKKKTTFFEALIDWIFGVHGYAPFNIISPYLPYAEQKCKVCGKTFKAWKPNPTCQNIKCFIKWRIS